MYSSQADESCLKRSNSTVQDNELFKKWIQYVETFKDYYDDLEECNDIRRKIFEERMKKIDEWNKEYEQGLHNFTLGETIFTAKSDKERKSLFTFPTYKRGLPRKQELSFRSYSKKKLPAMLDWRKQGVVSQVKYQFTCSACYAFSVVDALTAQYAIKTGKLVPLSAQMIIDCTLNMISVGDHTELFYVLEGNVGCKGGFITESFHYIIEKEGIATDKEYPFIKKVGKCREHLARNEFKMKNYVILPEGDEEIVKETLVKIGPLAVAVDGDLPTFEDFRGGGIYDDPRCKSKNVTHSGLLVGYGTERGIDYWLVKNNWSKLWGDKGYIKIRRNNNNRCGVASFATYPII